MNIPTHIPKELIDQIKRLVNANPEMEQEIEHAIQDSYLKVLAIAFSAKKLKVALDTLEHFHTAPPTRAEDAKLN